MFELCSTHERIPPIRVFQLSGFSVEIRFNPIRTWFGYSFSAAAAAAVASPLLMIPMKSWT